MLFTHTMAILKTEIYIKKEIMVLSKKGLKIINCMLRHHPYYHVFEDPPHTSNIQTNEPLKKNTPL